MNYYYLLIPLLLSIVIIILFISLKKKKELLTKLIFEKHDLEVLKKEELKKYFEEEWYKQEFQLNNRLQLKREEIENKCSKLESDFNFKEKDYINELSKLQVQLNEKEARYREVNQDLDLYRQGKIKEIDGTAAEYEQRKRTEIEQILKQKELQANNDFNNHVDAYIAQKAQMQADIETIRAELEIERSKRAAINEEIRRQKEVEEQQDFYRIQLDPNDKDDVEILRSVAPRLRHPEAINKVIWSGYYQKPLAELRKRVAIEGPGVYKITRIKTNEIYIGQAVNVSTRWADHCKAALGVGTLASSQLHRVMAQDGCENFTFELLEAVPKEKLRERESYYIDFYDSKNYGLNTISGDKNK